MTSFLFVYGTLRKHSRHAAHGILETSSILEGSGWVQGILYDLRIFPAAIPSSKPGDVVRGEIYRMLAPESTLARLDQYEGCGPGDPLPHPFRRDIVGATLDSGEQLDCWIYWYAAIPRDNLRVPSGDYLQGP